MPSPGWLLLIAVSQALRGRVCMPCSIVDFVSTLVPLHVIAQVVVVARGQFYSLGAWRLRRISLASLTLWCRKKLNQPTKDKNC